MSPERWAVTFAHGRGAYLREAWWDGVRFGSIWGPILYGMNRPTGAPLLGWPIVGWLVECALAVGALRVLGHLYEWHRLLRKYGSVPPPAEQHGSVDVRPQARMSPHANDHPRGT
jgi:hypothetical protein